MYIRSAPPPTFRLKREDERKCRAESATAARDRGLRSVRTGADRAEGRRVQNLYGKLWAAVITLPPPTIRQRCVSASTRTGPPVKPLDPTVPLTPLDNPHGSPRTLWQVGRPVSRPSCRCRRVRQHSPITAHSYLGPVPHDTSYYAKCMLGGALACGFTHAGITPLDVTKCNMQVCSRLSQLQLVLASWPLQMFLDIPFLVAMRWQPSTVGHVAGCVLSFASPARCVIGAATSMTAQGT